MHILDFCYIYGILPFSNAGYRIFLSVLGFSNFVFWVLDSRLQYCGIPGLSTPVFWHSSAVSLN